MQFTVDVVVIGGGQSGLVTGYFLNQQQPRPDYVLLDANRAGGGSWQHYYESLTLFSPAKYGELPGLPFPGNPDHHPTRYEVIDYLREYERAHNIPVRRGVRVTAVTQDADGTFTLHTEPGGTTYRARSVISASGPFNTPHIPPITGDDTFTGARLHAFDYHTPQPYAGQHIVVVGSRDSAIQIAHDLAPYARVTMAVRHPLQFFPRTILGKSLFWWLHDTGYDQLPLGLLTRLAGSRRIVGREPYQSALATGNPAVKPMFTTYTADGVVWGDGTAEAVDTVIYATGYNPGLGYLRPLGALDDDGYACHHDGVSERVPGLFFVGLFGQRSHASATLRGVGRDAGAIARRVAAYLTIQQRQAALALGD